MENSTIILSFSIVMLNYQRVSNGHVIFHSYVAVYQRVTHPEIFMHHFHWIGDWSLAGATDINTKLTPEVSTLNKGAAMLAMLHTPCEHQKNL